MIDPYGPFTLAFLILGALTAAYLFGRLVDSSARIHPTLRLTLWLVICGGVMVVNIAAPDAWSAPVGAACCIVVLAELQRWDRRDS